MDNPYCMDYPNIMFIGPKNWKIALQTLDKELENRKAVRDLIVCGGTALLVLDVIDRETRDIDVVCPEVDLELRSAAVAVAKKLLLPHDWINDGPKSLANDLLVGWKERVELIFQGKALTLYALGRVDLLATKVYAFCDREDDYQDVLKLKPTSDELEKVHPWVIERDASPHWPVRVESCFARLRKKLYGK